MSDHNFEKQIQQKLDELKIPPADKVWSSVEARIRKDRRRRRGLIFFPLFLLLTGAGGYFISQNYLSSSNLSISKSTSTKSTPDNNNGNTSEKTNVPLEQNQQQPFGEEAVTAIQQPDKAPVPDQQPVARKKRGNKTSPGIHQDKLVSGHISRTRQQTPSATDAKDNTLAVVKNRDRNYQDKNQAVQNQRTQKVARKIPSGIHDHPGPNTVVPGTRKSVAEEVSNNQQINPVPEPHVTKIAAAEDQNSHDSANTRVLTPKSPVDTPANVIASEEMKPTPQNVKTSWKWGLTSSAGISNLNEGGFFDGIFDGILGVEKAMVADVSPLNSPQSNAGPTAVIYQPSEIQKGLSFSLGAFVQKNITKRISFSTGLQYRYYSNYIQVGNRIDSFAMVQNAFGSQNISQYYRAAPIQTTHKYTNRFHFIELPVSGQLQLNKGNRLPISWNAGISLSYLLSTNVLHFDSRTGLYYKDNDLLNRFQVGMSTGFAVTLLNASTVSIQLGPQLQYHFTDLMKQKVSDDRHLFYFGLNSRVFLKK